MDRFDVFLSYSGDDRAVVSHLADALEGLGLRVWFDQKILTPGVPWHRELTEGVAQSAATAVCIGATGMGKWQVVEMETALAKQVESDHRVIPVILPDVAEENINLPSMLRRNTWVLMGRSVQDKAALERLYWGITGKKTAAPNAPPPVVERSAVSMDALNDAASELAETLRSDNVTYFLGPGAARDEKPFLPTQGEITRGLLQDLKMIGAGYDQLLPPVDVAGSYYAYRSGAMRLEDKVAEMIANRPAGFPPTHGSMAELISVLAARPKPRIRGRMQQLIVTTNLDVMMERALLQRGISFTRLVQHTSTARIQINQYRDVAVMGRTIQCASSNGVRGASLDDPDGLDELISTNGRSVLGETGGDTSGSNPLYSFALKDVCGDNPVLYKFRGSVDVRGSCALSVDQYLNYKRRLLRQNQVPAQIMEILNNSQILLLGYGLFDPDFRLIYHGLLHSALELRQDPVYCVQLPPIQDSGDVYRKMEVTFWDKVKSTGLRDLRITTLESGTDEFVRLLISSFRESFRAN